MRRMKLTEWENIGNCRLKTFCHAQLRNAHNGSFHSSLFIRDEGYVHPMNSAILKKRIFKRAIIKTVA